MKNGRLKNSITYLILALFFSMKMANLHVLLHTDDQDHALHCTVCDHAITHNLTPVLTPDLQNFTIEISEYSNETKSLKIYNFMASSNLASGLYFSRPPPSFLYVSFSILNT